MAAIDVVDGARSPAPKCRRVIVVDESHEEPSTCKLPRSVASASPSSATTSPNHLSDVPCPLPRRIERVRRSITFPVRAAFPEMKAGRASPNLWPDLRRTFPQSSQQMSLIALSHHAAGYRPARS